jgi:peptidoglycan/xylan/chitin deacetylase (PgdA/CDA1 family)
MILCYHGISSEDEHRWNPALFMAATDFRQRLEMLRERHCTVLPLDEAVSRLYAQDLPPRSVAITFDDGFYNFFEQAYPILSDFGYPATVYLTTFYCQYNKPIFLLSCAYLLWKGRRKTLAADGRLFPRPMSLRTVADREAALATIRQTAAAEQLSREQENQLLEELADRLDVNFKEFLSKRLLHLLNPQEVRYLASRDVSFEMHMHYHCSPDDKETYVQQLGENRALIQEMTGQRPSHFCYPSGNHRPETLVWLEEQGIASATTCRGDLASPHSHRLLLPRLLDHSGITLVGFESWLSGLAAVLPRDRRPMAEPY